MPGEVFRPLAPPEFKTPIDPSDDAGDRGELVWVPLERLVVDTRYQRLVNASGRKNVRTITEHFSWARFDPLMIAPADGLKDRFAILDGQHRAMAATLHPRVEAVPAYLHRLDLKGQARAFMAINADVTQVTPLQLHHAGVAAEDPDALFTARVCEAAGVMLPRYPKSQKRIRPDETMAVKTIRDALKQHGERPVRRTLEALRAAYPEWPQALAGRQISTVLALGLARPDMESEALAGVLQDCDLEGLSDAARSMARFQNRPASAILLEDLLRRCPAERAA
ncbi:hypothetical protein FKB34_01905 [Glycocaulis profundi]|nr:hypothetical protein FKB34_01905 [Glycocaulis profundi]